MQEEETKKFKKKEKNSYVSENRNKNRKDKVEKNGLIEIFQLREEEKFYLNI